MTWWFLQPITSIKCVKKDDPEIDKSKLTKLSNLKNADMLNKPFDPNNDYSIPYIWGATAIGVNGDAVDPKSVTSWANLWKPEYKVACC